MCCNLRILNNLLVGRAEPGIDADLEDGELVETTGISVALFPE